MNPSLFTPSRFFKSSLDLVTMGSSRGPKVVSLKNQITRAKLGITVPWTASDHSSFQKDSGLETLFPCPMKENTLSYVASSDSSENHNTCEKPLDFLFFAVSCSQNLGITTPEVFPSPAVGKYRKKDIKEKHYSMFWGFLSNIFCIVN